MRGRLYVIGALLALCAAGCGDKSASAGQADPALTSARLDGGGAGGPATGADASATFDDVAMPPSYSDELDTRMRHLVEAIAQDNPDLAGDVLFPRDAYLLTRDSSDAAKAWERRIQGGFKRSVASLHKKLKGVSGARFVSFELGHSVVQITPKKKDWKRPLWRVKHSKLTVSIEGKQRQIDIAEMTSWRGAWYVTKLR